jgi:hypothetical protein
LTFKLNVKEAVDILRFKEVSCIKEMLCVVKSTGMEEDGPMKR